MASERRTDHDGRMKNPRSSEKPAARDAAIRKTIGGQPENDQDARDAGLKSATSAEPRRKSAAGTRAPVPTPPKQGQRN